MTAGSLTALTNLRIGTLKINATGRKTARMRKRQRHVQRRHEPGEVVEHTQSAVANRVGDGRTDADRCVVHHDVRELEHRFRDRLAPGDDRAALLADHAERNREDDAEDDDLQDVALGHCVEDRLGDDVEEYLVPRLRLRGDLALLPDRQVDADARPGDVDGGQADDERDGRDDLEVDDRAQAHSAHDLHMAGAGDAGDQRGKDQGRDDHLDQAQEELAERPEVDGPVGVEVADEPADDDPDGETDEDLLSQSDSRAPRRCRSRGVRRRHRIAILSEKGTVPFSQI